MDLVAKGRCHQLGMDAIISISQYQSWIGEQKRKIREKQKQNLDLFKYTFQSLLLTVTEQAAYLFRISAGVGSFIMHPVTYYLDTGA